MTYCFEINIEKKSCIDFLVSFIDSKIRVNPKYLLKYKTYLLSPNKYLGFYASFPLFFLKSSDHSINKISIYKLYAATALYLQYIKIKDDIEDEDKVYKTNDFDFNLFKLWSIELLKELFSLDSIFWNYLTIFNNEMNLFTKQNPTFTYSYENLNIKYFIDLARAKGALAKFPALAVGILTNDLASIKSTFASIDSFNIGYQFIDDLVDFNDDLKKNRLNSFVHYILFNNSKNKSSQEYFDIPIKGYIKDYLNLVLSFYTSSLNDIKGNKFTYWENVIKKNIIKISIMQNNGL